MKSNILGMEGNMEYLLEKIMSVQSRSDSVNTSLFEKREHIEKLHRTCNLLRKVQILKNVCQVYIYYCKHDDFISRIIYTFHDFLFWF
ncbi:hypothetical protein HN51_055410 [Arachis hypogaea]